MKQNKFLILLFALILALPALDSVFHFSPIKELFEKRLPVKRPNFPDNFSEIKEYPGSFEKFFGDNYGFRKTLISMNSRMMDKIFDESPDSRAVIGKEDWFYFDNNNSLLDSTGKALLSDELVENGVKSFYDNWQKLRARGIDYLLIIAADKATVYPEFLPDYIKYSGPHRIDKFLTALIKAHPDFPLLDLRPILIKAKEKDVIYHKTDTHWNRRGAHAGYVEVMKMLSKKNPHLTLHLRKDFIDKEDGRFHGDISDIMNSKADNIDYNLTPKFELKAKEASSEVLKGFHKPALFLNRDKSLPIIFVYKDSFFGEMTDLVAESFYKSFTINEYPCDVNYEAIKKYHPNVVIQEFWEGRVEVVLSQCKTN